MGNYMKADIARETPMKLQTERTQLWRSCAVSSRQTERETDEEIKRQIGDRIVRQIYQEIQDFGEAGLSDTAIQTDRDTDKETEGKQIV